MTTAALDIARMTGVAVGGPGMTPVCWTEDLGERGHQAAQLMRVVAKLKHSHGVEEIVIEKPILVMGAVSSADTLRMQVGLAEVARGAGVYLSLRVPPDVEPATWRKHFLGTVPKGRDEKKRAVMVRCKALGWRPTDNNQSDALGLLDFHLSRKNHSYAVQTTALFGRAPRK